MYGEESGPADMNVKRKNVNVYEPNCLSSSGKKKEEDGDREMGQRAEHASL